MPCLNGAGQENKDAGCEHPLGPQRRHRNLFFKADKLEEDLQESYDIEWPTSMKITQAVDEMYRSNMFTKEEMMT